MVRVRARARVKARVRFRSEISSVITESAIRMHSPSFLRENTSDATTDLVPED